MPLPYLPLVSVNQLHENIVQENLLILDASMPPVGGGALPDNRWPDYRIAGAIKMNINEEFSDDSACFPHTLLSPHHFQKACRKLGVNKSHHIVVYDDLGLFSAARAWWMFMAMGHKQVSILDGGLPAWLTQGFPTQSGEVLPVHKGDFSSNADKQLFCTYSFVQNAIETSSHVILDARSFARFSGEESEPRQGVRSGHMPNAKNLPYTSLLKQGLLQSKSQLKKIFISLNPENKPMIMTCGSGITACILALAAYISGYEDVLVYDGSWAEWGSLVHLPIVTVK